MTLGEKIKYYRELQQMSQENLAELSHVSVSAIRKYEAGLRFPKDAQIEKLSLALHTTPAALKETQFDSFVDLLPYFFEILRYGKVTFTGSKDENGGFNANDISVRFNDEEMNLFLKELADKKQRCDEIRQATAQITDPPTKELMLKRLSDLETDIEEELIFDKIADTVYKEYSVPDDIKPNDEDDEKYFLLTYANLLTALRTLARVIPFECVGIYEKTKDARAIFTFKAEDVDQALIPSFEYGVYSMFLYCFDELKKTYKIDTEAFEFIQDGFKYFRFIIKDRIIASSMPIIQRVLQTDYDKFKNDEEQEAFEVMIDNQIEAYRVPIERIDKMEE
ncbi:MAG: helix-turn-helix domain-containing protein [Lachnospiraceae bacterium]|nr:helix-turn-helix domain-containing protein [Lachnospiraceae bacterium]